MGCLNISVKIKQDENPSIVFKSIPNTIIRSAITTSANLKILFEAISRTALITHRILPSSPSLRIKCAIACSFDSIPSDIYFAKSRLDWLNNEINIEKINTLFSKGDWSLEDLEFEDLFDD